MKILNIISSLNPAGGGPIENVKNFGISLNSLGHQVEVACFDPPNETWIASFPFKVYALGPAIKPYYYSFKFVPWLKQNAHKYDCIVVRGIWQYSSFGTWLAMKSLWKKQHLSPPYFVFTHGMLDPWFKYTYPLKHLKKMLFWPWTDFQVLRDAKAVLFTCEEERRLARQSFWPYKCNEAVVNYGTSKPSGNPDYQRGLFFEKYSNLVNKRILLFMGRIHPKKGCDLLIEAFASISHLDSKLHLVIAGPDQVGWQAILEQQAEKLNILSKITWTGMLSGDLKWGAFYSAEVFVLPSHQENFGIVVAESLACGVPVLISNKVNIWHEIEEDEAGIVANDDLIGITNLLQKWLNSSPKAQMNMRKSALNCFLKRFEISIATRSLVNILAK